MGTYDREALAFVDEGNGLLSIRNLWEGKYIVYQRRITEIIDEQDVPYFTSDAGGRPSDPEQIIAELNELSTGVSDLPEGGAPGQVLVKASENDFDATWSSLPDLTLYFNNNLY